MKILHIASINDDGCSGVPVAVKSQVSAQSSYADTALLNVRGIRFTDLGKRGIPQFDASSGFPYADLPGFGRPDVAVFHEFYRTDYLPIFRKLKKSGIPYIIIPHGELRREAQRKKILKKTAANVLLFHPFLTGAAAVQFLSDEERNHTRFAGRSIVSPNGVEVTGRIRVPSAGSGVRFVYIGRYEWRIKGLDILLEAVSAAKDDILASKSSFALYGPDVKGRRRQVEELVSKNGVGDVVSVLDPVTGPEKERILLCTDVFVQCSRSEGMPMGILEALSYGIPCIVTDGTAVSGAVNEYGAGWGVPTTVSAVAGAIRSAIAEKSSLSQKTPGCVRMIEERFETDRVARDAVEKYAMIAGGKLP